MEEQIKGFYPNEIVDLYCFLCIYESDLMYIEKQENLWEKYPKLKRLKELISTFECNYCTQDFLKASIYIPYNNLVSMTRCRSSKLLSLLHHLRNSIAHGQIEQDEEYVHLIDYNYEKDRVSGKKQKMFSAMGKIKSSVLFEMIRIINKNIKL